MLYLIKAINKQKNIVVKYSRISVTLHLLCFLLDLKINLTNIIVRTKHTNYLNIIS